MSFTLQKVFLWKTRSAVPGTALTDGQQEEKKVAFKKFWEPRQPGQRRPPKVFKQLPRLHTQEVIRNIDNALRSINLRLWQWKLTAERAALLIELLQTKKLNLEALWTGFGWICLWCDRASRQWQARVHPKAAAVVSS